MLSYTGEITKEAFVAEIKRHADLDHFLQGIYSDGVKGCAVGCAIKSINRLKNKRLSCSDHKQLEIFSICPQWMARLIDTIFEGVSLDRAKIWPLQFAEAINIGADLDKVKVPFAIFILENNIKIQEAQLLDTDLHPNVRVVISDVIKSNRQMIAAQLSQIPADLSAARSAA